MSQAAEAIDTFRLEIGPDSRYVATARMFAAAVARHYGCEEERVQDLKVAVSEACTNSIKAHQTSGAPESIRIEAWADGGVVRYDIIDTVGGFSWDGRGVDFSAVPDDPAELLESGIGLSLIEALFPDVRVEPHAEGGTVVRFSVAMSGDLPR